MRMGNIEEQAKSSDRGFRKELAGALESLGGILPENMTREERRELASISYALRHNEKAREMRRYIQHGSVTTYQHCLQVMLVSFWLNRRFRFGANEEALITGAFLHDFYLYDWHEPGDGSHELHGYHHAERACRNAREYFDVDPLVAHIIYCHMWPLNITRLPRTREAWIVTMADKYVSTRETLFQRG